MDQEKKAAATTYIFSFYNDVQALLNYYAFYVNTLATLRQKYGDAAEQDLTIEGNSVETIDAQRLLEAVNNVTFVAHKIYVEYAGVCKMVKLVQDAEINELYKILKKQAVPSADVLERYVILLNSVLVEGVIQEVLINSQDFINQLFTKKGEV